MSKRRISLRAHPNIAATSAPGLGSRFAYRLAWQSERVLHRFVQPTKGIQVERDSPTQQRLRADELCRSLTMDLITRILIRAGILRDDLDYNVVRASMVIIFLFFGYQKWFDYEAQVLIPFISNGPLIAWMYTVFGIRGASWFLGVSEWLFGALLLAGFWNKKLGILGALGSCFAFIATITIIPFMPNGWAASAGGFPAMTGNVAFLMKDVVLLAASFYLLRQDVLRASWSEPLTELKEGCYEQAKW
jgi:uncharacterized membrane protein YkgB